MTFNVVGISGSPREKGNVETFLEKMLNVAAEKGAATSAVHLSKLTVNDCIHCNFCLSKQKVNRYCALKDDAQKVFDQIESADIILLASPVYFMRTSARMAALIDRLRVFIFGNMAKGKLKNKIGVSAAVAWARHGGLETTHMSHIHAFLTLEMIPVSVHHCISPMGASAVASPDGSGQFDPSIRIGVENDVYGLHSGNAMMERAFELAQLISP